MGQESWSDCCSHTDGGPETAAREAHSKNKVCVTLRRLLFLKSSYINFITLVILPQKIKKKRGKNKYKAIVLSARSFAST